MLPMLSIATGGDACLHQHESPAQKRCGDAFLCGSHCYETMGKKALWSCSAGCRSSSDAGGRPVSLVLLLAGVTLTRCYSDLSMVAKKYDCCSTCERTYGLLLIVHPLNSMMLTC